MKCTVILCPVHISVGSAGTVMSVGRSEGWSDSLSNPTDFVHISVGGRTTIFLIFCTCLCTFLCSVFEKCGSVMLKRSTSTYAWFLNVLTKCATFWMILNGKQWSAYVTSLQIPPRKAREATPNFGIFRRFVICAKKIYYISQCSSQEVHPIPSHSIKTEKHGNLRDLSVTPVYSSARNAQAPNSISKYVVWLNPWTDRFQLRLIRDGVWMKVEQTPKPTSAELAFARKDVDDYRSS